MGHKNKWIRPLRSHHGGLRSFLVGTLWYTLYTFLGKESPVFMTEGKDNTNSTETNVLRHKGKGEGLK